MSLIKKKIKQESLLAGQAKSIPVYYEGQNAKGKPDHFMSSEQARSLRAKNQARFVNRGTAILISTKKTHQSERVSIEAKSQWAIVGQTSKRSGPGFPRWNSI